MSHRLQPWGDSRLAMTQTLQIGPCSLCADHLGPSQSLCMDLWVAIKSIGPSYMDASSAPWNSFTEGFAQGRRSVKAGTQEGRRRQAQEAADMEDGQTGPQAEFLEELNFCFFEMS